MKLSNLIKSTTAALILSTSLAVAQIPAAFADDPIVLQIAEQLATQGFEITEVKITLLGRYKIEATAPGFDREIVIAAGSGTVLRDEWNATDSTDGITDGSMDGTAAGYPDEGDATEGTADDSGNGSVDDNGNDAGNDNGNDNGNDAGNDNGNDNETESGNDNGTESGNDTESGADNGTEGADTGADGSNDNGLDNGTEVEGPETENDGA